MSCWILKRYISQDGCYTRFDTYNFKFTVEAATGAAL